MLRLSYAQVKLYLYRPFLHYLTASARKEQSSGLCNKASTYAVACLNASHQIIHSSYEMFRGGILRGAYWHVVHMVFSSILALMYIVFDSCNGIGVDAIFKDIAIGRKVMSQLARYGVAAVRGNTLLTVGVTPFSHY
jgi:hypothetical protein